MTAPKRRWFRFRLRTLFVVVTVLALACGWFGYELNWLRQRRRVISQPNIIGAKGSYFLEAPPVALWPLRMLGEDAYRRVILVIVDKERFQPGNDYWVEVDDERLTALELNRIEHLAHLFPEAIAGAWFREKTEP